MQPQRNPAPFLVGVARSGTTLLRLQLDAHPQLAIPPETGFGQVAGRLAARNAAPTDVLDAITALPTWPDLCVEPGELTAAWEALPDWSVGNALRAYYQTYAAKHGKARWGDKTPGHTAHVYSLWELFPEAHFIHLVRDGRDVAASLREMPFAPGDRSIEALAVAWRTDLQEARRLGSAVPHYREVRYEQLVAEPEATLRELSDFLELEFDGSMLLAHERAEERLGEQSGVRQAGGIDNVPPERRRIFASSLEPVDASRVGGWRDALTAKEIARFEAEAGETLEKLGYELAGESSRRPQAAASEQPTPKEHGAARFVLATYALNQPGGTETYVLTVARELLRLGYDVTLTAEEFGPMAELAERNGIDVAYGSSELPPACETVFAHDAVMAARLVQRYPEARLVFFCHSDVNDYQLPLMLPGVVSAVVVASDRIAARVRALALDIPMVRLRHPIDTELFADAGPISARPRRAVLLGNYLSGGRREALVNAWEAAGVKCVQVGHPGQVQVDVLPALREADIVVAKARAALEAMSCARAVYVYDQTGGDGWVTPEAYPAMEADNFAGQATGVVRGPDELAADLTGYRPEMGWVNRELIRKHHGARRHTSELVKVMRGPAPAGDPAVRAPTVVSELARWVRLSLVSERRAYGLQHEVMALHERTLAAEAAAEDARAQLRAQQEVLATSRVQAGLKAGRVLDRLRGRR